MKFKKSYLLIISLISILLCMSAVSASDIDSETLSDNSHSDLSTISTNDMDIESVSDSSHSDLTTIDEVKKDNNNINNKKLSSEDTDKLKDNPQDITPKNTTTESEDKDVMYNKSVELNVNVKDNDNNTLTNLNKTHFNVTDLNDGKDLNFTYSNSIINITTILNSGLHNIAIKFKGNNTYNASETIIKVNVYANTIITDSTVSFNSTKEVSIPIKVQDYDGAVLDVNHDDFILNLTYFNGTDTKNKSITGFTLSNAIIRFIVDDLTSDNLNNANVTIYYKNGDLSNLTKPFVVKLNYVEFVNTTIESKNKEVLYNNTLLDVTVKDNASKVVTGLTKDEFTVFDVTSGKYLNFTYKDSIITVTDILDLGLHNITIKFLGNVRYNASETSVNVTVFANILSNSPVLFNRTKEISIPIKVIGYDGTVLTVTNDFGLNITYRNGTESKTKEIIGFNLDDHIIKFNGNNFDFAEYLNNANVTIYYKTGDLSNFINPVVVKLNYVEFVNTTIESKNKEVLYNNTLLDVTVKDNASKVVTGLTKDEFTVFDVTSGKYLNFTYKDSIITVTDILDLGLHNITIKFLGNVQYNASETNVNVTVFANTITAPETVNVYEHSGNVTIGVTVQNYNGTNLNLTASDFKLNLTYFNGTDNITVPIDDIVCSNGTLNFKVDFLNQSKVTIYYKDNDPSNFTKSVVVSLKSFIYLKIDSTASEIEYQSGNFVFQVVDSYNNEKIANKQFSVGFTSSSVTFVNYFTTDANGYLNIPFKGLTGYPLAVGKYNLSISTDVKDYVLNITKYEISVKKAKANIVVDNYNGEIGQNITYVFKIVNANTGTIIEYAQLKAEFAELKFTSGYNYFNFTTNTDGIYTFTGLKNLLAAGVYTFTISSRDDNLDAESVTRTITVNKKVGVLEASNRKIQYNSDSTVVFTLKDQKTGAAVANTYVNLKIYTGSKYTEYNFRTNSKGQVVFITPLSLGKHKIVISTVDSIYTAKTITRYVTVKKTTAKFKASNVKTYYKSSKVFTIKLINTKLNKPLYAGKVNIKVYISKNRYYNLVGNTNIDGLLRFTMPYKPGKYKVVISSNDTGYSAKTINRQIKITKAPVKITPTKFRAKSGKKLKIKVIGKYNKKAVKKLKLKVKISRGKTSKTYTVKTNKKGFAYLKIKQKPGKYNVAISPNSAYYKAKTTKTTIRVKK